MEKKWLTFILLVTFLSYSQVNAETVIWDLAGGGSWNTAANWNPDKIPEPGDNAVISGANTGTITVDSNSIVKTLTLAGGHKVAVSAHKLYISSAPLKIFVTSATGNGDLGSWTDAGGQTGLAAADAICQARAAAAGFPGVFRAWLSDDTSDAYCRVHNFTGKISANCGRPSLPAFAGPWARTDGFPFGGPIQDVLSGIIYAPVRHNEYGVLAETRSYFTNTMPEGTLDSFHPSPCSNWTSNSGGIWVLVGSTEGTTITWTGGGAGACNSSYALLCMQISSGPALPSHASVGKKVFVTSAANGNLGGLAGADALCQTRASAAGLANASDFKAWLSDSFTDAKDHITTDGPWVRIDGVKVADNKADLVDSSLITAISLTEAGTYLGGYLVWTGTGVNGVKSANNCNNWSSGTNSFQGDGGNESRADASWTSGWPGYDCSFGSGYIYCFED
jgi:hypothetical protein